jgi:hypothetical protein
MSLFLEFSVRMWPLFGHDYLVFGVFWPNVAVFGHDYPVFRVFWPNVAAIRTRLLFIWSFLFECGRYSDTITLFLEFSGRMWPLFGHDYPVLEFSGRMWPLFGHDYPVFRVYCPNVAAIRTRSTCF